MTLSYPDGATPLDPDTLAGLIPSLTTQGELDEFEARNILGVPWPQIAERLDQLCGNVRYQVEHAVFAWDECAARFHHEMVLIHPFPNGNGRHARLAADLLLIRHGQPRFTWGGRTLGEHGDARRTYIDALRAADQGEIAPLLSFVRS